MTVAGRRCDAHCLMDIFSAMSAPTLQRQGICYLLIIVVNPPRLPVQIVQWLVPRTALANPGWLELQQRADLEWKQLVAPSAFPCGTLEGWGSLRLSGIPPIRLSAWLNLLTLTLSSLAAAELLCELWPYCRGTWYALTCKFTLEQQVKALLDVGGILVHVFCRDMLLRKESMRATSMAEGWTLWASRDGQSSNSTCHVSVDGVDPSGSYVQAVA